jgi:ribosome maturation factor RimP
MEAEPRQGSPCSAQRHIGNTCCLENHGVIAQRGSHKDPLGNGLPKAPQACQRRLTRGQGSCSVPHIHLVVDLCCGTGAANQVGLVPTFFWPKDFGRVVDQAMQQSLGIAERVQQAVAPVLEHLGFELVLVEYIAKNHLLRLYIDKSADAVPAGVSLEDCTLVSRQVSHLLDAEGTTDPTAAQPADASAEAADMATSAEPADAAATAALQQAAARAKAESAAALEGITGHYTLEVSSPGLDRPLVTPAHFARFVGHTVMVSLGKQASAVAVAQQNAGEAAQRKWTGNLLRADDEGICLMTELGEQALTYGQIGRARLVPQF